MPLRVSRKSLPMTCRGLPFPDDHFHAVDASLCSNHLPREPAQRLLGEMPQGIEAGRASRESSYPTSRRSRGPICSAWRVRCGETPNRRRA